MSFFFSKASSNGTRLNSGDTLISPAPTYVVYPEEALGQILETQDALPVFQQASKDGRIRRWVWEGYRDNTPGYATLWNNLLSLRSRHLKEAGAQTPYVYLKETDTKRLRRRVSYKGTATAGGASTLTDSGASFPGSNGLAGYLVYLIDGQGAGQTGTISTNTTTQITITSTWSINPNTTTKYEIVGWVDDWFRCRVIDVSRSIDTVPSNPPIYKETAMTFVIDDAAYNDLG